MTELEQHIQSLEAQIRVMTRAIATAKNGRRKAADVVTLATLQGELERLKDAELQQMIDENATAWEGVNPDEFMDMVRGREPDIQQAHDEAVKENNAAWDSIIANAHARAIADELKNETNAQPETVAEESNDSEA